MSKNLNELGNKIWRARGVEKREKIFNFLSENPFQSLYHISKSLNTSAANIKHHVEILEAEGRIHKNIQILGNKVNLSYFLNDSGSFKFYINEDIFKELQWEKMKKLHLYIVNKKFFILIDNILHSYETKSLMRISLNLHKDDNGHYIIVPKNISDFFHLESLDIEDNQSMVFDPRKHLIIHLR